MLRCVSAILVTHRSDRQTFSLFAPLFCSARVLTMFRMGSARKRPTQRVSTHVVPEGLIAELNISELSTPGSANLRLFGSRQHNDPKAVFEGLEGASLQAALNHFSRNVELSSSVRNSTTAIRSALRLILVVSLWIRRHCCQTRLCYL